MIAISHENGEGETQMFDDVENGYIQVKVGGSGQEATFTVDSVAFSNASYSQLLVTYHAGNSSSLPNNSICYVSTLHIEGIDLNDLEQELDTKYVKLAGDSEIVGKIEVSSSPGSTGITLNPNGELRAKLIYGDASNVTNSPHDLVEIGGSPPLSPKQGELWFSTEESRLYISLSDSGGDIVWVDTLSSSFN